MRCASAHSMHVCRGVVPNHISSQCVFSACSTVRHSYHGRSTAKAFASVHTQGTCCRAARFLHRCFLSLALMSSPLGSTFAQQYNCNIRTARFCARCPGFVLRFCTMGTKRPMSKGGFPRAARDKLRKMCDDFGIDSTGLDYESDEEEPFVVCHACISLAIAPSSHFQMPGGGRR